MPWIACRSLDYCFSFVTLCWWRRCVCVCVLRRWGDDEYFRNFDLTKRILFAPRLPLNSKKAYSTVDTVGVRCQTQQQQIAYNENNARNEMMPSKSISWINLFCVLRSFHCMDAISAGVFLQFFRWFGRALSERAHYRLCVSLCMCVFCGISTNFDIGAQTKNVVNFAQGNIKLLSKKNSYHREVSLSRRLPER